MLKNIKYILHTFYSGGEYVSKTFKCPKCNKTFKSNKELDEHVKKAHPKK